MDAEPTPSPSGTFWTRHKTALIIAGLGLTMLCAIGIPIVVLVLITSPSVTPEHEKLALQALDNPDDAKLHLGHCGDYARWQSPVEGDYGVEDGMAILPDDRREPSLDTGMPVLVYAPDGRDLGSLPPPPTGLAVKSTDWFLVQCRAVPSRASWWSCDLMFGSWLY